MPRANGKARNTKGGNRPAPAKASPPRARSDAATTAPALEGDPPADPRHTVPGAAFGLDLGTREQANVPAGLTRPARPAAGAAPAKAGTAGTGPEKASTAKAGAAKASTAKAGAAKAGAARAGAAKAGTAKAGTAPAPTPTAGKAKAGTATADAATAGTPKADQAKRGKGAKEEPPDDLPAWAAKAVEQLLTASCWFDPGEEGDPFSLTISFSGRRTDITGRPQPGDTFTQQETVDGIVPGSGPVAVTAEVRGISSGEWEVTARPVARPGGHRVTLYPPPGEEPRGTTRVSLPRRVTVPAGPTSTISTSSLLFTKVPGVFRFAYSALVGLGMLVGLAIQSLLLTAYHYSWVEPLLLSAAAVAAGAVGGKAWYIAVHRGKKFDGWCVQGFITGAAAVVSVTALTGPGVPAGAYLGSAASALLFGMAIGRPGCFWAGCCTGRPTQSRWGIWASDRRVGCRRMPAQLLEALASLVCGTGVLAVVLIAGLSRSGPAALAGLAGYTLLRQLVLGLRAEPPWRSRYGHHATTAVAAVALIAGAALLAV